MVLARVVDTQYYSGLHAIAVAATIKARLYDIGIGVDFESITVNFKACDKPEYDDYEEEGREYEEEGVNTKRKRKMIRSVYSKKMITLN
ncbi:hypothetical protein Tco_0511391 [Tanacetum coccineum]